jgi:glycosyltransferase involved in cell wall biosynthesis
LKVAFVVQRYGMEINGGAELHCRYVAERLARHAQVEVLTTRARDYIRWENHYPEGNDKINDVPIRRFSVEKQRDPLSFGRLQENLLRFPHTEAEEFQWIEEEGPCCPALIRYIQKNESRYDFFIFFSYRYYHSFHGVRAVPHKSLLVPTAEHDPIIHFDIFRSLFNLPRGIVYNSVEERRLIQCVSSNYQVAGDVVGVGSQIPSYQTDSSAFRRKHNIHFPYLIYVGRIDENKGCRELFEFFLHYKAERPSALKLLLVGSPIMKIPENPDVVSLGFLNETEKFDALAASELLVMPSFYESLSMVLLEAWGMGKPTLANANCRVLMGQSIRSNAGLFYRSYQEFKACLDYLQRRPRTRAALGLNGKRFFYQNYRWEIIEQKYLNLMSAVRN